MDWPVNYPDADIRGSRREPIILETHGEIAAVAALLERTATSALVDLTPGWRKRKVRRLLVPEPRDGLAPSYVLKECKTPEAARAERGRATRAYAIHVDGAARGGPDRVPRLVRVLGVLDKRFLLMEDLVGGTYRSVRDQMLRHFDPLEIGAYKTTAEYQGIIQFVVAALLEAVADLHARGLSHQDIKPSNLGFDAEYNPKLFDFGALVAVDGETTVHLTTQGIHPEGHCVVARLWHDTFAVGQLLLEAFEGDHWELDPRVPEYREEPRIAGPGPRDPAGHDLYRDLVKGLLDRENGGMAVSDALRHPFIAQRPFDDKDARERLGATVAGGR